MLPTRLCQVLPQPCLTLVLAEPERIHQQLGGPPAPQRDAISVPVTWVGSVLFWELTRVPSEGQYLSSPQGSTRTAGQALRCSDPFVGVFSLHSQGHNTLSPEHVQAGRADWGCPWAGGFGVQLAGCLFADITTRTNTAPLPLLVTSRCGCGGPQRRRAAPSHTS